MGGYCELRYWRERGWRKLQKGAHRGSGSQLHFGLNPLRECLKPLRSTGPEPSQEIAQVAAAAMSSIPEPSQEIAQAAAEVSLVNGNGGVQPEF